MKTKFLVFTYKVPSSPSKNRVYIWRTIKNLGAIYMQQGVALFPFKDDILLELQKLDELAKSSKGKSSISELSFLNKDDEDNSILEFQHQSSKEYLEFDRNCKSLIYELDRESDENSFNFYELEESEATLEKLEVWLNKIAKRDYFNCGKFSSSSLLLNKAKERVELYSREVYKKEITNN